MTEHDEQFACMGTTVRLVIGASTAELSPAAAAAADARRRLEEFDRRLSRFREDSELSALNADERTAVPASALLCTAVGAGLWAAERTGGLVDPTLVDALEAVGYARSRAGAQRIALESALAVAPPRRPARPSPRAAWQRVRVDPDRGFVYRPPGIRLDTGGTGKGLAADMVASRLGDRRRFVVDCGGDLRIGGSDAADFPYEVEVLHPLTGAGAQTLNVGSGGVATSGIDRRAWATPGGGCAHHLLDPSTGLPAWTGLVGATALAPTALEADVLAKAAVLSGPAGARTLLRRHGGIFFHDDGHVERVAVPIPRAAMRAFMTVRS
jgi:thiamine biosynthesis lipoprotein